MIDKELKEFLLRLAYFTDFEDYKISLIGKSDFKITHKTKKSEEVVLKSLDSDGIYGYIDNV